MVKSYGYSGNYNILVMELLGKSLEDLFVNIPGRKMSVRCVCNIGFQVVTILQYVHNKHIIHRDIKPDNFVIGTGENAKKIYLLDFGLAKKYRSSTILMHYQMNNKKKFTGTARYSSINSLRGIEQSRRDDLEAMGYVLLYFLRGSLLWQGLQVKNLKDRYRKIMEKKKETSPEELCKGFPKQFEQYVSYTRNMEYEQDPDYDYLKNLFIEVLTEMGCEFDYYYDWSGVDVKSTKGTLGNSLFGPSIRNVISKEGEGEIQKKNTQETHIDIIQEQEKEQKGRITVVNNYYNNVQNIVINGDSANKKEDSNKEVPTVEKIDEKVKKAKKEQNKCCIII